MSDNDDLVSGPVAHIASLFGAVAADEFRSAHEEYKAALLIWAENLRRLTDTQLIDETESAIYQSALVNSWRGNHQHIRFRCTACNRECERRDNAEHAEGCPARGNRYQRAYNRAVRGAGHDSMVRHLNKCTCAKVS